MTKRLLFVAGRGGPPLDYALPRMTRRASLTACTLASLSPYNERVLREYSDDVVDLSALARSKAMAEVGAKAASGEFDGILTFSEHLLEGVSAIAAENGRRGAGPSVSFARDKALMRGRWAEAGVPQPRHVVITKRAEAADAVEDLELPVVIKWARGVGSIGLQVVRRKEELPAKLDTLLDAVAAARAGGRDDGDDAPGAFPTLIAEELIRSSTRPWYAVDGYGDFVSVEGIVRDQRYYPLAITGRFPTIEPFTELGNVAPCVIGAAAKQDIVAASAAAVNALGLENCATHTEMKLKPDGTVSLLECAARMGGVGIARELDVAFGIDFVGLLVGVLLGERDDIPAFEQSPTGRSAASLALIGADSKGQAWSTTRTFAPGSVDWEALAGPGTDVDVLRSQSIEPGLAVPAYTTAAGVTAYAGQAFLTSADPERLLASAYRILDGLEAQLPVHEPAATTSQARPSLRGATLSQRQFAPDQPAVVVVGGGTRQYREYLLASMARHHPLWLIDTDPAPWTRHYVAGCTDADVTSPAAVIEAARDVARRRGVVGVVCFTEMLLMSAAETIDALGVPGISLDGARRCRDKRLTRQALLAAGVPQPRSEPVSSAAHAREVARDIGFPVVVKPRGLGGSWGVVRADGADEVDLAFRTAGGAEDSGKLYERGVLVEEMLDGPEISIDGFVCRGRYRPLFIAHKLLGPPPYFEEDGHVLSGDDPLLEDESLRDLLEKAHQALGVDQALTHSEVRLTAAGPRIVEINGRAGGDLIPYLGWLTSGVDPAWVAVHLAVGADLDTLDAGISAFRAGGRESGRPSWVGIRFTHPEADCLVRDVRVPSPASTAGLLDAYPICSPGSEIRRPPHGWRYRTAFVMCEADDEATCRARLESAAAAVELDAVWLPPPGAELTTSPREDTDLHESAH